MSIREKLRPTLFGKLLLIFMGLAILLIVTFSASFHFMGNPPFKKSFQSNIIKYSVLLKNELGRNPSPDKIKHLAKELNLKIAFYGPFNTILSEENIPNPRTIRFTNRISSFPNINYYHDRYKQYVFIQDGVRSYMFGTTRGMWDLDFIFPLAIALGISITLLFLAYQFVSRLFRPLVYIKEGAENYAKGNFDYKIPNKGSGPLAELSDSVRVMSENIQEMLDSKRELLLSIAHELKTPLARARLHVELMEDENGKQEMINEINEMNDLVTDILESERLKSGHAVLNKSSIDMNDFLSQIIKSFSSDKIKLLVHENCNLDIDEMKYSLLVKNLITNAIRHSEKDEVEVILKSNCLHIVDCGKGMSEEDIGRVTNAFYRIDKSRVRETGGVGLGLYLSLQIAKAHGHNMIINSELGKGTDVKICFQGLES